MEVNFHLLFEGKNARVRLITPRRKAAPYRRVSSRRLEISSVKVETGIRALPATEKTIQDVLKCDPEVDATRVGRVLDDATRAYYHPETGEVARDFKVMLVSYTPDGEEKERKDWQRRKTNINHDAHPIQVGKLVPRDKFYSTFVIERAYQLCHDDGVKYDFLYTLAKKLADENAVALLGAGPKGTAPLVFKENGRSYRCALSGEIQGERYLLLVLALGQELKVPENRATDEVDKEDEE